MAAQALPPGAHPAAAPGVSRRWRRRGGRRGGEQQQPELILVETVWGHEGGALGAFREDEQGSGEARQSEAPQAEPGVGRSAAAPARGTQLPPWLPAASPAAPPRDPGGCLVRAQAPPPRFAELQAPRVSATMEQAPAALGGAAASEGGVLLGAAALLAAGGALCLLKGEGDQPPPPPPPLSIAAGVKEPTLRPKPADSPPDSPQASPPGSPTKRLFKGTDTRANRARRRLRARCALLAHHLAGLESRCADAGSYSCAAVQGSPSLSA